MANIDLNTYCGGLTETEELKAMTEEQLRALKLRYSEAKSNTPEHQIFVRVDRLLRSREGTWVGRTL